jgi:hypothetical protein
MPCSDVTEVLRLRLDEQDRLAGYQLIKRSCGRAVGEQSLLAAQLDGRTAQELIALLAEDFADAHPTVSDEEMFLQLKHFFAVQAGLRTLLGLDPGGTGDPVRVAAISYEGGEVVLEAELVVDVLTDRIKSCGKCKGCSALRVANPVG